MLGLLIFDFIIASCIIIIAFYAIYILYKINKFGQDNTSQQAEFMLHRSRQMLIFSIISISLFVASTIGYVLLITQFDTEQISEGILGFILSSFLVQLLPLGTFINGIILSKKGKKEQLVKEQQERERENSLLYFRENSPAIIEKYTQSVINLIDEISEYPFVGIFNDSETPLSSILIFPYRNSVSNPLQEAIRRDGLRFTESQNAEFNKRVQELMEFFIKGLKQRIEEDDKWQDLYTLPLLLYTIVRNNVIKYFHNKYLSNYGYENIEDFCANVPNAVAAKTDIVYYVYHYIYETDICLPFIDTYRNICGEIKNIVEARREEKLKDTLFGNAKRPAARSERTSSTLSPIERVDRMSGEQFEVFMEHYFIQRGYKVERTPLSGDYGVDLIIEHELGGKIGVQLKCYSKKVPADAVQEVFAGLQHYKLSSGMVITNNYFQPSAIRLAADNNITLWDRNKLIEKLGE